MNASKSRVLIVGCGYVGRRLARVVRDAYDVVGIVRTQASCDELGAERISAFAIDFDDASASWPDSIAQVSNTILFYCAPPPNEGLSDTRLDRFLRRIVGAPSVFVYMSTTGVYGNCDGAEVDESTPVNPQTDRAQRRMSGEHMTRIWCNENQVRRVVLRVPGIYGPGRIALARLQRREPFIRVSEAGVSNRIHVDDLVAACVAVAQNERARGVYNITDGNSMSSTEFMRRVAAIANLPVPVEITREEARHVMSAERLSFLDESRRVSNRRLVVDLGFRVRYSDVNAGIAASL